MKIIVSQYGEGEVKTINEAIERCKDVKEAVEILVKPGIYEEKVEWNRNDVSIIGEDPLACVITYGDYAKKIHEDGKPYGTFRTATLKLTGNRITVKNITVINSCGNGRDYGQGIALYLDGDCIAVDHCRMIAHQDTLFTGPTTECKQNEEANLSPALHPCVARQYYRDCYIQGDIDFIFGGAAAFFDHCEIYSKHSITEDDVKYQGKVKGYATAACTWRDNMYGYVFSFCNFTGDCPEGSVYLGRPWRIYAKTVLLNCQIGAHIKKEGWHDWDKEMAHENTLYAEYNCIYEEGKSELKDKDSKDKDKDKEKDKKKDKEKDKDKKKDKKKDKEKELVLTKEQKKYAETLLSRRPSWVKVLSAKEAEGFAMDLVLGEFSKYAKKL